MKKQEFSASGWRSTKVISTDPILVTWQSTVYEPSEDGFKKRPKHVAASVKCFNVNFSAF